MSNSLSGGEILSQVTIYSKYARYLPHSGRRENWNEIVDRTVSMHCRKYPKLEKDITSVFDKYVRSKLVLPSMRSLQFIETPGISAGGINEAGLAIGVTFVVRNTIKPRPGIAANVAARWILDNFATTKEAIDYLRAIPHVSGYSHRSSPVMRVCDS